MMNRRIFLFSGLLLMIAGGLGFYFFSSKRPLVVIGDYQITKQDRNYRDQVQKIFYPQDSNSYGLQHLEKSYLYAQILKNNGLEITEAALRAEEMRIQQNTKNPEVLRKIQDLFKGDTEAYQKVFVLPTLAERVLYYDFFLKNPKAQSRSLSVVREFLKTSSTSQLPLKEIASKSQIPYRKFYLSKEKGFEWIEEKSPVKIGKLKAKPVNQSVTPEWPREVHEQTVEKLQGQSLEVSRFWVEQVLPRLSRGEMIPEPVDFGEQWMVVKYVKPVLQNRFEMEAVFFPKDNFNEWLESEKSKVRFERSKI